LVQEKHAKPATAELAARAGCSVRSVFERFQNIEALELAALDHLAFQLATTTGKPELQADRRTRMEAYINMRAATCEAWIAHWRVLRGTEMPSEGRLAQLTTMRQRERECIFATYHAELSAVDALTRRNIVVAVQGLTAFESWGLMRDDYGLSVDQSRDVWTDAIDRLLPRVVHSTGEAASRVVERTYPRTNDQ
jgi:AcrR family transcriptional regulator